MFQLPDRFSLCWSLRRSSKWQVSSTSSLSFCFLSIFQHINELWNGRRSYAAETKKLRRGFKRAKTSKHVSISISFRINSGHVSISSLALSLFDRRSTIWSTWLYIQRADRRIQLFSKFYDQFSETLYTARSISLDSVSSLLFFLAFSAQVLKKIEMLPRSKRVIERTNEDRSVA